VTGLAVNQRRNDVTDPEYCHYALIVDRSGSVRSIKTELEGGISNFIESQRELPGRATLTLHEFDDQHGTVYDFTPLDDVKPYVVEPRGMTRLNDAVCLTVNEVGEKLAAMPEDQRPGKVLVLIASDGIENDSKSFSRAQVREMIRHQREVYGWEFTFLGTNQDAFAEAREMGLEHDTSLSFDPTPTSVRKSWDAVSAASTRYRCASVGTRFAYTVVEQEEAAGASTSSGDSGS
jgi:uncharacterized protein YegL